LFTALFLSLVPISELRGAIPYAVARGAPWPAAFLLCVTANMLVGPIVFLFLSTAHRVLLPWPFYARLFERLIGRARRKVQIVIERYGYLGLLLFVAIPLPLTGAYTGALGAWVLGMERKRACLVIAAGVLIAGVAVTLVTVLGIRALGLFIRAIE
jgi:uncharacterized membrane protein